MKLSKVVERDRRRSFPTSFISIRVNVLVWLDFFYLIINKSRNQFKR